jgi:GDP-L-fucose synthase
VRPTIVVHLAGRVAGIQGNLDTPADAFAENALINVNVVEASRLAGVVKVVAAGSVAIYSDDVSQPIREDEIWSGPPHQSEAAYAHAKRALLAHLEACRLQDGMDYAYLICTNLYGPHDRFDLRTSHVVPSLVARFRNAVRAGSDSVTVWGDGTPTRDFLYADDAAEGFVVAAATGHGPMNLASGRSIRIADLVETLTVVTGFRGAVRWDTSMPLGQLSRHYDISRITSLGWQAAVPLAEGLDRTYRWYSGQET